MNIVTTLILIVLGVGIGYSMTIVQSILLWRIYRTNSWLCGAIAFLLLGGQRIYTIVQLPSIIVQAQMHGTMIDHISASQWFGVIWSYVTMTTFIVFLDWQRRDLIKLGVGYRGQPNGIRIEREVVKIGKEDLLNPNTSSQ